MYTFKNCQIYISKFGYNDERAMMNSKPLQLSDILNYLLSIIKLPAVSYLYLVKNNNFTKKLTVIEIELIDLSTYSVGNYVIFISEDFFPSFSIRGNLYIYKKISTFFSIMSVNIIYYLFNIIYYLFKARSRQSAT